MLEFWLYVWMGAALVYAVYVRWPLHSRLRELLAMRKRVLDLASEWERRALDGEVGADEAFALHAFARQLRDEVFGVGR